MYVDSFYVGISVDSRYKGITAIKPVTLSNFFGEEVSMQVYEAEFEVIGTFRKSYKTNVLVMEDGEYSDFEGAIAAKVYSFLEELNLVDANIQDLKKENPEAFMQLCEKCRAWVFEIFNAANSDAMNGNAVDYTFNNFFELLTEICLISAHAMLAGSEGCDYYAFYESKRRFDLISNQKPSWFNVFEDVDKKVEISVKPDKVKHSTFQANMYKTLTSPFKK